jgi:hypothetical protein
MSDITNSDPAVTPGRTLAELFEDRVSSWAGGRDRVQLLSEAERLIAMLTPPISRLRHWGAVFWLLDRFLAGDDEWATVEAQIHAALSAQGETRNHPFTRDALDYWVYVAGGHALGLLTELHDGKFRLRGRRGDGAMVDIDREWVDAGTTLLSFSSSTATFDGTRIAAVRAYPPRPTSA